MLTIVNVISAIPILAYPVAFIVGVMVFDAPGSEKSILAWLIALIIYGYPVAIISLIIGSRVYDSLPLALTAFVPIPLLVSIIVLGGGMAGKSDFDTYSRDFTCGPNSYLMLSHDPSHNNNLARAFVYAQEKKNFFTYRQELIATIYDNKWLSTYKWDHADERNARLFTECRNKDGKSLSEIYKPISEERENELLKSL